MRYHFNLKFFLLAVGVFIASAAAVYAVHRIQQPRNARSLLVQADRAEAEQHLDQTLRILERYLNLNPTDTPVLSRSGELLERLAGEGRSRFLAIEIYQKVLTREPGKIDDRERLAKLLTAAGRWDDAIGHLQVLQDARPKDGAISSLLGRCFVARRDWNNAAVCYEKAIALPESEPETFARYADCLRRLNKPKEADEKLDQMVKRFDRDFRVFLVRSLYRSSNNIPGADEDLRKAKELAPDAPEVLLTVAETALRRDDVDTARSEFSHGLTLYPKDYRFYLAMAQLDLSRGKSAESIALLKRGIAQIPNQTALIVELIHQLIDTGDILEARATFASARVNAKLRWGPYDTDLLTARLAASTGNWSQALPILDALERRVQPGSTQSAMIDRLRGKNAARLGDLERQIEFLENSIKILPNASARLEYALALVDSGKEEAAVREFQILAEANPPSLQACLTLARWKAARILETVGPQGDWAEVKELLRRAETSSPRNILVAVTTAEIFAAKGEVNEARKILESICKDAPTAPSPWIALVNLEIMANRPDAAQKVYDSSTSVLGNQTTVHLLAIFLAAQQPRERAIADTIHATKGLENLPPEQATRVWGLAATLYMKLERFDLAIQASGEVVSLRPDNLQNQLLRFEAAVRGDSGNASQIALEAIRRIDGTTGVLGRYCEAFQIITRVATAKATSKPLDKTEIARARDLLTEAGGLRPSWPKIPLLRAQLELLEGQPEQSIRSYRQAFDLGERSFEVVRLLIENYVNEKRYPEAYDLIRRLQDKGTISLSEQRMFTAVYLQAADYARALETVQKSVKSNSSDPKDQLWLSWVYTAAKRLPEAEAALIRACELSKTSDSLYASDPWVHRVRFLIANKRTADVEAVLKEIPTKIPAEFVERTLGECYEALNRSVEAEQHYRAFHNSAPNTRINVSTLAAFYQRNRRFALADPLLRRLINDIPGGKPEEIRELRRRLAIVLAENGDYRKCGEALDLLKENIKEAAEERPDLLVKAAVLAKRPGNKNEAIALYEKLAEKPLAPEDRYIFAQLMMITGGITKAREQLLLSISQSDENPDYVVYWVNALLADKNFEDANYWISKLVRANPDRWFVVELQAQLLQARGQTIEAAARVARYVPKNNHETLSAILRLEEYKDTTSAEKRFKDLIEKPDSSPMISLAYAGFLARQKRDDECLAFCDRLITKIPPPVVAGMALEFFGYSRPDSPVYRHVEGWLDKVKPDGPDARAAAFMRADAFDRKGDYTGSINAYRQLMTQERDNPLVLYPLARLLLFANGSAVEAEDLLRRAIAVSGPQSHLLELRAAALFQRGQTAEAVAEYRHSLSELPTANGYFFLAAVCHARKDKEGTEAAIAECIRRGFKLSSLHPLEAKAYPSLLAAFPNIP